ncbi:anthrone oxygenase family protein [Chitinophagaceae bacterium MMS25-I14]
MNVVIPQFIAVAATGLLAGAFMYGLLNVVPTFYEVPLNVHLTYRTHLMSHNGATMQLLMAASIIAPLWYAAVVRYSPLVTGMAVLSALLALTSLLVTRFGNVPINQLIKTWAPDHPPANWMMKLHTWDRYNRIRSFAALGCFISFIITVHLSYFRGRAV